MKKGIQTRHKLDVPVDAVWNAISNGAEWENWLPILSGSTVSGNKRTCVLPTEDGGEDIIEELFLASNLEKTFIYQINQQNTFPASDIIACIKLLAEGESTTMLWSVEMNVESDEVFEQIRPQIEEIYSQGASQLEAQLQPALS